MYIIQKRMLNLNKEIGNKGDHLQARPFIMYSAGLYDSQKLKEFNESEWKKFALGLWECEEDASKNNNYLGFQFDGTRNGSPVKVYTPQELDRLDAKISEDTLKEIHQRIERCAPSDVFIIAPKGKFAFAEDEIDISDTTYHAFRIPYSMMASFTEDFTALLQPIDLESVNQAVESKGFDFVHPPKVEWSINDGMLEISEFKSNTYIKGKEKVS